MFGKRSSLEPGQRSEGEEMAASIPGGTAGGATPGVAKAPARPEPSAISKPRPSATAPYDPTRRVSDYMLPGARRDLRAPGTAGEGRKLVVGQDISLAGEIKSCEQLIVEGEVEADLKGCRLLQISESGLFRGCAEVELAEISGRFEGDLVVTERLTLRGTGRISGSLRYAELEIERGGRILGSLDDLSQPAAAPAEIRKAKTAEPTAV